MNNLLQNTPSIVLLGIFLALSVAGVIKLTLARRSGLGCYFNYIWIFFLILVIADLFSFYIATWGFGILSFFILREYFSLVDLRPQDRLGILASYFSIPFMMHFVHTDWYNMFIISIPVYSFLFIPFLISITGKETDGAIYSIGTIDFGLFLFVFCIGHLAYLAFYSTWMATMLVLNIMICDVSAFFIEKKTNKKWHEILSKYFSAMPFTVVLTLLLSGWTGIPINHSIILGLMIPAVVLIGNHTIIYFESDLGITRENTQPGRGLIIDNIKSVLYAAPVVLHYIRYFIFD
nr:phosphatidate cytidylyltransferase [Bacteroidota bacterium]